MKRGTKDGGKSSALERLKERRAKGTKGIKDLELKDDDKVYDEVDEADYQMIVRRRLNEEFVVDDDGLGYVDYGVDDWNGGDEYYSDSEGESSAPKKSRKCDLR